MKRRVFKMFACICILIFVFSHCARNKHPAAAGESKITVHTTGIDYIFISWNARMARSIVFSSLFKYDEKGNPQGDLVEAWEHSPNYHTWTYHLRNNVMWHDGVSLTAHDIKFTYDLFSHPEITIFLRKAFSLQVIDDFTFRVTYNDRTLNPMTEDRFILPRHLLKDLDPKEFSSWEFFKSPVGCGPYRFVRRVPKIMMEFEFNPEYHGTSPQIKRVILKNAGNPIVELLSHNVDASSNVEPDFITFAKNPDFRIYQSPSNKNNTVYWNIKSLFFRDKRVRKAVSLAINRRELCRLSDVPDDVPLVDGPVSKKQLIDGNIPQALAYDPHVAEVLLEESGWIDTDGDGVRDRGGKKFQFMAIAFKQVAKEAVYVQAQLKKVGIEMEIQTYGSGPLLRSKMGTGEYDACFFFSNFYWDIDRILDPNSELHTGYTNPELVKIIEEAENDMTPGWEERRNMKIWKIFQEEFPLTYLHPLTSVTVAHRRVKGLISPSRIFPEFSMEHLWIE